MNIDKYFKKIDLKILKSAPHLACKKTKPLK